MYRVEYVVSIANSCFALFCCHTSSTAPHGNLESRWDRAEMKIKIKSFGSREEMKNK